MPDDSMGLPMLLTVGEAAKALRLTEAGLRKMLSEGSIRGTKVGRRWVIRREEVLRIIEQGTKPIELAGGRKVPRLPAAEDDEPEDDAPPVEQAGPRAHRRASFNGAPVRARVIG